MTSPHAFLLVAFLTLGPTTIDFNSPGTADTASISGQAVILETGDAASHTRIVLKDRYGIETLASTIADAEGIFRLSGVSSGIYSVEARHGFAISPVDTVELVLLSKPIHLTGETMQLTIRFSERLVRVHWEQERLRREREEARRQGIILMRKPGLPLRSVGKLRQSGTGGIFDEMGQNLVSSMQLEGANR